MAETTIQWTSNPDGVQGYTFNFEIGCTAKHTGCRNCFAREQNAYRGWVRGPDGKPAWGPGVPRKAMSDGYWKKPIGWARAAAKAGERRKVFCGSLCDVLDEEARPDALARLWDLIRATAEVFVPDFAPVKESGNGGAHFDGREGGLTWLVLTKRPERWRCIPHDVRRFVWFGTSVSNQPTWDEWVGRLAKADGFARLFVSLEPMVGPVDGSNLLGYCYHCDKHGIHIRPDGTHAVCGRPVVSWLIAGGESGSKARPCDVSWIRAIVGQCKAAGVVPFVKQLGALPVNGPQVVCAKCGPYGKVDEDGCCAHCGIDAELHPERFLRLEDSHGGNPDEWPEPFPREFPEVHNG